MEEFLHHSMILFLLLGAALAKASRPLINSTNFTYWCEGTCGQNVKTSGASPQGGLILMGGGTDTDDAFKKLIQWSDNGNILIIRAYGVWDKWNRTNSTYLCQMIIYPLVLILFLPTGRRL